MVEETVQDGSSDDVVAPEDLAPLVEGFVGISYLEYESGVECSQEPESAVCLCSRSGRKEWEQCVR